MNILFSISFSPRFMIPYIGTGHFRYWKWPVPSTSDHFQSVPVGSLQPESGTFRAGHVPTKFRLVPCWKLSELFRQRECANPVRWKLSELGGSDRFRQELTGIIRQKPARNPVARIRPVPAVSDRVAMTWVVMMFSYLLVCELETLLLLG